MPATRAPDVTMQTLSTSHEHMLVRLSELRDLMDHLERRGVDASSRHKAQALVEFFTTHARQHHRDEELHIFPALLATKLPDTEAMVRRLEQDHGWLEEDWIELSPMLQAVASDASYDLMALRPAIDVFSALYLEHIELEDSRAYPEARTALGLKDGSDERARRQMAGRASARAL